MTIALAERGVNVVLLDIEGTTTPVTFVYDVLFPYARERLRTSLRALRYGRRDEVFALLREEHARQSRSEAALPVWKEGNARERSESAALLCEWLMDRDVKAPGLKLLQGIIWEDGYSNGTLIGEVFPDVPAALRRWTGAGKTVAIYSSGSVLAQRLIFGHTKYGDLTTLLSAFFDTGVGPKKEAASYTRIAAALGVAASRILFISDSVAELEAARAAGMQIAIALRPGNSVLEKPPALAANVVQSFDEIAP